MRTAQSKLPSEAGPKLGSLRPAGGAPGGSSLPRLRERRASRPSSRTGAGRSKPCGALSSPPLHPGVCRQVRGARKKVTAKTGPFPRPPTLRPPHPETPHPLGPRARGAQECARPGRWGACALRSHSPGCLEVGEFSFKPALPLGHPPRPTGGDDVRSLVARRSPGCRCRSLTGAALRRQQPDLWRGCSRGDCCHPRTCQPGGWGLRRGEIKVAAGGASARSAPELRLQPGSRAPSSAPAAQTPTPPLPPVPGCRAHWAPGRRGGGGEGGSGNRRCFSPSHSQILWEPLGLRSAQEAQ